MTISSTSRALCAALVIGLLTGWAGSATSTYLGLIPGVSTREQVDAALGPPTRTLGPAYFEYRAPEEAEAIRAAFGTDGRVLDRIEILFRKPVARAALVRAMHVAPIAAASEARDGALVEYFGGNATYVWRYERTSAESGVKQIQCLNQEAFDRALSAARASRQSPIDGGTRGLPSTPEIPPPPPPPPVQRETLDPAACRDVYDWARAQSEVAARERNTLRRQIALRIMLAAQRGGCDTARKDAERYKRAYR